MVEMKSKKTIEKTHLFASPFKFISSWRSLPPYELISYVLMYSSVPMLAYGFQVYNWDIIKIIVLTILTLYSGYFAALIWNDITDANIDAIAHPDRPIPSGRITSKKFFAVALVFSALTFIFAFLVSTWCLILVGATALFTTFHNKYLKQRIKIPAYSEIFTPVQWVTVAIFGFLALWTALPPNGEKTITVPLFGYISFDMVDLQNMIILVLFTYFVDNAHDLPEGIRDVDGDRKLGVKTYATSFGEKNAARISFVMYFISGMLGILLFFRTILSPIFLILFILLWIYMLNLSYKLLKSTGKNRKKTAFIVGRRGFDYFLMCFNLIFLDMFIQLILNHYNITIW